MDELLNELKSQVKGGTPAARRIARFMLENLDQLRYETAASIAVQLNLSPMTVGRFLRTLGVNSPEDIETAPSERAFSATTSRSDLAQKPGVADRVARLTSALRAQLQTLRSIEALIKSPAFLTTVTLIEQAEDILVRPAPGLNGMARQFADHLRLHKDPVTLIEGTLPTDTVAGHGQRNRLILLIEDGHEAESWSTLTAEARAMGYRIVLICEQSETPRSAGFDALLSLPQRTHFSSGCLPLAVLLDSIISWLWMDATSEDGAFQPAEPKDQA